MTPVNQASPVHTVKNREDDTWGFAHILRYKPFCINIKVGCDMQCDKHVTQTLSDEHAHTHTHTQTLCMYSIVGINT